MDPGRRRVIHDAMVRLADGDRMAFPLLTEHLWPVVLAFAQRRIGHDQDAEDVAQEVFLRICARISEFDRERDGLSWVFGLASYEIMTLRRRKHRRRETFDHFELHSCPDQAMSQEEYVIQQERSATLALAIGEISGQDRLTLGLGLVGAPEARPDSQPAALRKRRQRALDRLRTAWRRLYGGS